VPKDPRPFCKLSTRRFVDRLRIALGFRAGFVPRPARSTRRAESFDRRGIAFHPATEALLASQQPA